MSVNKTSGGRSSKNKSSSGNTNLSSGRAGKLRIQVETVVTEVGVSVTEVKIVVAFAVIEEIVILIITPGSRNMITRSSIIGSSSNGKISISSSDREIVVLVIVRTIQVIEVVKVKKYKIVVVVKAAAVATTVVVMVIERYY